MDKRTRSFEAHADETREGIVRGVVTTFDDPYAIGGGRQEIIKRGTFSTSKPVVIMYEHDWSAGPIGVTRSLDDSGSGLEIEVELFLDNPRANAVWRAMKAGALNEWSVGFIPEDIREDGRTDVINRGRLLEVSSVLAGANPNTETLSVRAVPPAAVDPTTGMPTAPVPPAPGAPAVPGGAPMPPEAPEEPTMANLLGEVAEAVQMAIDLKMDPKQFVKLVQSYFDMLAPAPAEPAMIPNPNAAPGAAPVAPPAPAGRSANADLPESLLRALGSF